AHFLRQLHELLAVELVQVGRGGNPGQQFAHSNHPFSEIGLMLLVSRPGATWAPVMPFALSLVPAGGSAGAQPRAPRTHSPVPFQDEPEQGAQPAAGGSQT